MASLYSSGSISGVRARELQTAPDLLLANPNGKKSPFFLVVEAIVFVSPAQFHAHH